MGSAASSQGIGALAPRGGKGGGGKGGGIIPTTNQNIGANPNRFASSPLYQLLQQQQQRLSPPTMPSDMPQAAQQAVQQAVQPARRPLFQALQQQQLQMMQDRYSPQRLQQGIEMTSGPIASQMPVQEMLQMMQDRYSPQRLLQPPPRGGKGGGIIPTTNQNIGANPSAFSQSPLGQAMTNINAFRDNRVQ